jgi:hypothetical protein
MKKSELLKRTKKQLKKLDLEYSAAGNDYVLMTRSRNVPCLVTVYQSYIEVAAFNFSRVISEESIDRASAVLFDKSKNLYCGRFEIKTVDGSLMPTFQVTFPAKFLKKPEDLKIMINNAVFVMKRYNDVIESISEKKG